VGAIAFCWSLGQAIITVLVLCLLSRLCSHRWNIEYFRRAVAPVTLIQTTDSTAKLFFLLVGRPPKTTVTPLAASKTRRRAVSVSSPGPRLSCRYKVTRLHPPLLSQNLPVACLLACVFCPPSCLPLACLLAGSLSCRWLAELATRLVLKCFSALAWRAPLAAGPERLESLARLPSRPHDYQPLGRDRLRTAPSALQPTSEHLLLLHLPVGVTPAPSSLHQAQAWVFL
jgi:hypothetical protein